jgi:hypothetical protein
VLHRDLPVEEVDVVAVLHCMEEMGFWEKGRGTQSEVGFIYLLTYSFCSVTVAAHA